MGDTGQQQSAVPYHLVNKVLAMVLMADSKVTYRILESTIKRSFTDVEITAAKKMLWDRFPADPNETKVDKGKWIDRQKLELQIEDIYKRLTFLGNSGSIPQDCVCVPWCDINTLPEFLSDEAFELQAEKKVENDMISERMDKLEKQNSEIVNILQELKKSSSKPSLTLPNDRILELKNPSIDQPFSPGKRRKLQEAFPELGGVGGGGQPQGGCGEPSPSQYSRGGGVGPAHYAAAVGYQGVRAGQGQGMGRDSRDRSSSRLKAVSGTFSGHNEGGARKMKVAPVDIFVYGVHKATTPEDIVEELQYSDIIIAKEDIEEKTREGANVKSYKIAIKAEYLEKALKPETWPLRVKVREWIYFPRKREHLPEGGRMGQREARAQGRVDGAGASLYKHTTSEGTAASTPKQD